MNDIKEFIGPHSTLTPGFAGGFTMAVTNVVAQQFQMHNPLPAFVALGVSMLFALLIVAPMDGVWWRKSIFLVLNGLFIFTMALGANNLGARSQAVTAPQVRMLDGLIAPAVGQETGWCCLNGRVDTASRAECEKWDGSYADSEAQARRACSRGPSARELQQNPQQGFFRPWL